MQQPPNRSDNPNAGDWQPSQPPNASSDPNLTGRQPQQFPSQPLPPYSPLNTYYPPQPLCQQPIQPPPYPQSGQYQPMMSPPPPKKSKKGWLIAGIVIGALILCGGIMNAIPKSATTDTNTLATNTPQAQATDTPVPTDTPAPTADTHPHFNGDGIFEVGKDIQPGTYRTRVASPGCYYARLSGFGGTTDDIIANANTDAPAIITISATDKGFQSTSCGTWTKE